jgi:hypothetical protein
VEVDGGVARIVWRRLVVVALLLEALERRPRFDERAIHREVLAAHQLRGSRLRDHGAEELAGDVVRQESVAIFREDRRDEALLDHVHVEEPTKEQVVVELLAELPLAPHRVERHQQRRLEQPLRRDRRTPRPRVHRVEHRGQARERLVRQLLDRPKRILGRNPILGRHQAQHRRLLRVRSAHASNRSHPIAAVGPPRSSFFSSLLGLPVSFLRVEERGRPFCDGLRPIHHREVIEVVYRSGHGVSTRKGCTRVRRGRRARSGSFPLRCGRGRSSVMGSPGRSRTRPCTPGRRGEWRVGMGARS